MNIISSKQIHLDSRWFSAERDIQRTKGMHLSQIIDYIEGKSREKGDMSNEGHAFAAGGFIWEQLLEKLINRDPIDMWCWMFGRVLADTPNPKVIRPGEQCLDGGKCPRCDGTGMMKDAFVKAGIQVCTACEGTGRLLIYLTPDGYHIDDMCMEEWKYTLISSKWGLNHERIYRWTNWQIPAYLKALNLLRCRLRIYHVKGDYSGITPHWMEHMVEYTQQELDDTWEAIQNNAQEMVRLSLV